MTLAGATSSNGQTIELSLGATVGHFLVRHHDITIRGPKVGRADAATVRADGHYTTLFQTPFPVQTSNGQPVSKLTLRDVTLDADAVSSLVSVVGGTTSAGPLEIVMENVAIIRTHKNTTAIVNTGVLTATGVTIVGSGGGINAGATSTATTLRTVSMHGGSFGLLCVGAGADISGLLGRFDYWAVPTYEAVTATGYGAAYADVTSHVTGDRNLYDVLRYLSPVTTFDAAGSLRSPLVQVYDRIEVADGTWTQVIGFGPGNTAMLDEWRAAGSWRVTSNPTGTATVYRVSLGRSYGYSGNRILMQTGQGFPSGARWRSVIGETMETPSTGGGSRLDLIRVGGSNRDVDSGGVHITADATSSVIRDSTVIGGWSDMITLRGAGTVAERCQADLGQDMCFTVDGTNDRITVRNCHASRAGYTGFHLTGGPSDLYSCRADDNGTHNDGSSDHCGVTTTGDCVGSTLQVRGSGNVGTLLGGAISGVSPGGFESTRAVASRSRARSRSYRSLDGWRTGRWR